MSGSERKPGRLGPYVEGYRAWLLELGYTPLSVSSYSLVALGQLGRWMASEDLDVQQLDSGAVKAFLATRHTKDHRPAATASLVPLLDYLRGEGVTPPEPARAVSPLDGLIGEYRQWLIVDRALASATVRHRQRFCPALPRGADHTAHRFVLAGRGDRSRRQGPPPRPPAAARRRRRGSGRLSVAARSPRHEPVFLTLHAPIRPIEASGVRTVVREACRRAGLEPVGAHRLRHALASEMLRQDASLINISQVLRHKDLTTTAIYAKVDFARLREVAQPWPGVGR